MVVGREDGQRRARSLPVLYFPPPPLSPACIKREPNTAKQPAPLGGSPPRQKKNSTTLCDRTNSSDSPFNCRIRRSLWAKRVIRGRKFLDDTRPAARLSVRALTALLWPPPPPAHCGLFASQLLTNPDWSAQRSIPGTIFERFRPHSSDKFQPDIPEALGDPRTEARHGITLCITLSDVHFRLRTSPSPQLLAWSVLSPGSLTTACSQQIATIQSQTRTTLLLSVVQTTAGHAKVVCPPQLPFCISIGPHQYVMHHGISSHQRRLRTSRQRTPCNVPNVGSAKQSTHPYDTRCSCSHLAKLLHKHGNDDAPQRPGLTTRCPVRSPQRVYTAQQRTRPHPPRFPQNLLPFLARVNSSRRPAISPRRLSSHKRNFHFHLSPTYVNVYTNPSQSHRAQLSSQFTDITAGTSHRKMNSLTQNPGIVPALNKCIKNDRPSTPYESRN